MEDQKHMIMRQVIDVKINSGKNHMEIQDELSRIYRSRIVPIIEQHLNENSSPDIVQKIESLDLNLGQIRIDDLEQDLLRELEKCLKTNLPDQLKENQIGSYDLSPVHVDFELQKSIEQANRNADVANEQQSTLNHLQHAINEANRQADLASERRANEQTRHTSQHETDSGAHKLTVSEELKTPLRSDDRQAEDQDDESSAVSITYGGVADEAENIPFHNTAEQPIMKTSDEDQEEDGLVIHFSKLGIPMDNPLGEQQANESPDRNETTESENTERETEAQFKNQRSVPKHYELMIYFLKTGLFPWWAPESNYEYLTTYFKSLYQSNELQYLTVLSKLSQENHAMERYIHAMKDEFHSEVIGKYETEKLVQLKKYFNQFTELSHHVFSEQEIRYIWWKNRYELAFSRVHLLQQKLDKNHIISLTINLLNSKKYKELENSAKFDYQVKLSKLIEILAKLSSLTSFSSSLKINVKNLQNSISKDPKKIKEFLEDSKKSIITNLVETKQLIATEEQKRRKQISIEAKAIDEKMFHTFTNSDKIYIRNAGMVLFWPFLNRYFENLNYVEDREFKDQISREKACLMLQYLVDESTSKSEVIEAELPLNKLLCGIDLESPIYTQHRLTKTEIKQAKELISAVLQNAPMWKNLSIHGFQATYMQREAALSSRDGFWLLQVKRETYDILLDKLPWAITQVKLPWMKNLLTVEWQK